MRTNLEPQCWKADLARFGERNHMRPTRLEVLGPDRNIESDFWLEDGLLLAGIDLEQDRTYYALHFTVASDKLESFRDQMDSIALSFRMK